MHGISDALIRQSVVSPTIRQQYRTEELGENNYK